MIYTFLCNNEKKIFNTSTAPAQEVANRLEGVTAFNQEFTDSFLGFGRWICYFKMLILLPVRLRDDFKSKSVIGMDTFWLNIFFFHHRSIDLFFIT